MAKTNNETVSVSPSQLYDALMLISQTGRTPFIWGPPGVGKSHIIRQYAEANGYNFKDIRLSQMEPTSVMGVPIPSTDENGNAIASWAPPEFLDRSGKPTLYFFDELNSAPQTVQAAAYSWILDRKVGSHTLNDHDMVVAAGNRQTDKGSTFKMPTPLLNRLIHYELQENYEDWVDHAILKGIHPEVISFLQSNKHLLLEFKEPGKLTGAFPTPRSWEFVSDIMKASQNVDVNRDVFHASIMGSVGQHAGLDFIDHCRKADKLPNPDDVLNGKVTKFVEDKDSSAPLKYSLVIRLCYRLYDTHPHNNTNAASKKKPSEKDIQDWHKKFDNFLRYVMDNMSNTRELIVLGIRTCLNRYDLNIDHSKLQNWSEFTSKYASLVKNIS